MSPFYWRDSRIIRAAMRVAVTGGLMLALPVQNLAQQAIDLCGCASIPNLTAFDSDDQSTWPPGTAIGSNPTYGSVLTIPLPADGILRFRSFRANLCGRYLQFARNAANTPVLLLVAGDVTLTSCGGYALVAQGESATYGQYSGTAGVGGLGGPGGYRGGDGVNQALNLVSTGGAGLGPGGGAGGTAANGPSPGTFFGTPELLPLAGGSGGGGGGSFGPDINCASGGGGGGGGALQIVANGALTIDNFYIYAQGGGGANPANSSCASYGAGGSGGAVRLVAAKFVGTGGIYANGGYGYVNGGYGYGADGRIRLESLDASALSVGYSTSPAAIRVVGPGPVANPIASSVAITSVGGQTPPAVPQGGYGTIDIVLPASGSTPVNFSTSGVPGGTGVQITVKPRIGAAPMSQTVNLTNCDDHLVCTGSATFNLAAGAYTVEARATFVVQ